MTRAMTLPCLASLMIAACIGGCTDNEGASGSLSSDAGFDPRSDASVETGAPACNNVATMAAAPRISITGRYRAVADDATSLEPACFNRPQARSASPYLEFVDGRLRRITRTYASGYACISAAFDTGGDQELHDHGALHPCGPVHAGSSGMVQQVYWDRVLEDGTSNPVYLWLGTASRAGYDEVSMSRLMADRPMTSSPPDDLLHSRRPR